MARLPLLLLLVQAVAASAAPPDDGLTWRRRVLRSDSPRGYLAVVTLTGEGGGAARASLVCESEGVALSAEGGRWTLVGPQGSRERGTVDGDVPTSLFVKRTRGTLLVGLNGRWVYSRAVGALRGRPSVKVGTSPALAIAAFGLHARQPVRFADDFPNPEPTAGVWAPVLGRWALSSLYSPDYSANPAELAAIFGSLDDASSRGRTRYCRVGIGVNLGGSGRAVVVALAPDAPAARVGMRPGDRIVSIDGYEPSSVAEAQQLLGGREGTQARLKIESVDGKTHELTLKRALVVWGKSRRQAPLLPTRPGPQALITAGYDFWTDYTYSCAVRTQGVGAFGLVFAYLGPADYHVFRWLGADKVGDGTGRWQLERVRGGARCVLARREGGFVPRDFYAMSVAIDGSELGQVKAVCRVDGNTVLEAADDAMVPGKIGLWAEQPGAVCFDDVVVAGAGSDVRARADGTPNPIQRSDQHMKAWGNPTYAWQYDAIGSLWWHKADFPGDVAITAPVAPASAFRLAVSALRGNRDTGYALELVPNTQATQLKRQGAVVATKPLGGRAPGVFVLSRRGPRVTVELDGKPWMAYTDPTPLHGNAVLAAGCAMSGFRPSADVRIQCANVLDYFFNSAPVDWHVMHGSWEVMNRWICDPRWSFFGGRADGALAIWNKRRFAGDVFADVHLGPMMFERSGNYENLRDLGLTICGDGKNLSSGYTLIVGASSNSRTVLFRNGVPVASRNDSRAVIPRSGVSARRVVFPSRHRGWVPIKLTKEGGSVRAYLFDRLLFAYQDPEPLPGGYTAVWSVENGILLARARLAASRIGRQDLEPFLRGCRRYVGPSVTNDCANGAARVVARGAAYEITNTVGGGPFAVALRPRVFSAHDRPTVAFDIKLTPEAKVDLHLSCRGRLYRVIVAGPAEDGGQATTLGTIEGIRPDGQWHHVAFNLYEALRKRHADDSLLMVWDIRLANHSDHGYLQAGLSGNPAGAKYWLRNIRIPALGQGTRLTQRTPTE